MRERNAVKRDGNRLEHRCFGKRKIIGQAINNARRNSDVLGKGSGAAILGAGHSQDLAVVAKIHVAAPAVSASAAKDGRVKRDSIALGKSLTSCPTAAIRSGSFVPHDDRRNAAARGAVVTVDVAAADAASGDANQNFVGTRFGRGQIGDFQLPVFGKQQSFHGWSWHRVGKNEDIGPQL